MEEKFSKLQKFLEDENLTLVMDDIGAPYLVYKSKTTCYPVIMYYIRYGEDFPGIPSHLPYEGSYLNSGKYEKDDDF